MKSFKLVLGVVVGAIAIMLFALSGTLYRLYLVRTAPIATANSPALRWNREDLINWRYPLIRFGQPIHLATELD